MPCVSIKNRKRYPGKSNSIVLEWGNSIFLVPDSEKSKLVAAGPNTCISQHVFISKRGVAHLYIYVNRMLKSSELTTFVRLGNGHNVFEPGPQSASESVGITLN